VNALQIEQAAPAPTERPAIRIPWQQQFWFLLRLQFTEYRAQAFYLVIFSLVMPLGIFLIPYSYVGTPQDQGPSDVDHDEAWRCS
jgi:hypothetical protein